MKRIISFILKDMTAARRDNIMLYMLFAPILIAVIMSLFIPTFENSSLIFAVDESVGSSFTQKLKSFGRVIEYDDSQRLEARINANDNAIGITLEKGNYTVLLEGNEGEEIREVAQIVIDNVLRGDKVAEYDIINPGNTRSLIKEYSAILIILMAVLVTGMIAGFNIIDEKESKSIRAIAVTPLRMKEYLGARSIIIIFFSLALSVLSTLILLGAKIDYLKLVLGVIFSSGTGIFLGFLIGGFSDNQIKGIAFVKMLAFPYTVIPVASIFIPGNWKIFLYIFPNYWMFRTFQSIFVMPDNTDFWLSGAITLAMSAALVILTVFLFRKRLKLK